MDVVGEDPSEILLQEPRLVGGAQDHEAVVEGGWVDASRVRRVQRRQA